MELSTNTNLCGLMSEVPECGEFLHPFLPQINGKTTVATLALSANISLNALLLGLERTVKRAEQNPCEYNQMRAKLIKHDAVNVAGFVNFLWQNAFIKELKSKANALNIELNLNIFPKHTKKQFQNYLSVCTSVNDLPDILIGKGFSSLMTSRFIDLFVKPGHFSYDMSNAIMGDIFNLSGLTDKDCDYHPFGVDEMVMVFDKTTKLDTRIPSSWNDILTPEYMGTLMQMGKNQRDHFGFVIMLYLYAQHGEAGIEMYAGNVKNKQHFTYIIKNIGKNHEQAAPINVLHQFASQFIRSDAKDKSKVITTTDGNPAVCNFFLLKNKANSKAFSIANHLYSPQIRAILEKAGTTHITSHKLVSKNNKIRWIGWNRIKSLQHPYLKEYLSEIASNHYKNIAL